MNAPDAGILKQWRREFHAFPEIGWSEFVTTATLNTGYAKAFGEPNVQAQAVKRFLPDPDEPCASFSGFRKRVGPIA